MYNWPGLHIHVNQHTCRYDLTCQILCKSYDWRIKNECECEGLYGYRLSLVTLRMSESDTIRVSIVTRCPWRLIRTSIRGHRFSVVSCVTSQPGISFISTELSLFAFQWRQMQIRVTDGISARCQHSDRWNYGWVFCHCAIVDINSWFVSDGTRMLRSTLW
jgi:hypothetical protein